MAVDVSPQGDAGAIVGLPQIGYLFFVALQLQVVVGGTNVVFGAVHGHLEGILYLRHGRLELGQLHVGEVMRLASVGVDGGAGVAQGAHQVDKLLFLPAKGVVVVVDEYGIGPPLMGHLKGLDNPVVAGDAVTTEGGLVGCRLMARDSLVHHIDERQVGIAFLHGVHPLFNGPVLFVG